MLSLQVTPCPSCWTVLILGRSTHASWPSITHGATERPSHPPSLIIGLGATSALSPCFGTCEQLAFFLPRSRPHRPTTAMSKQKRARNRPPHERLSDEERSIKRVRNVHNRSQRNARWQCQKLGLGATHAKGQYGMSELLSAARTPGAKNTPRERVRAALPREWYRRRAECSSQSCEQTHT